MVRGLVWRAVLLACLSGGAVQRGAAQNLIASAAIGPDHRVHLRYSGGREQIVPLEPKQVDTTQLAISGDHTGVGWTAEFDECCASYPIPLVLVLVRGGRVHRIDVGQGIFHWMFEKEGAQVALFHDTLHGNISPTCELYDTKTWRRIGVWNRNISSTLPAWAMPFAEDVGPLTEEK